MAPARCGDLLPTTCQALNDDEMTLQWRPLDDAAACAAYAPPPRDGHTSVVVGDRMFVLGGADQTSSQLVPRGELEVTWCDAVWRGVMRTRRRPSSCRAGSWR